MKHFALLLCLLSIALPAAAASSADMGMEEVRVLGRLNGQALACSHAVAVARIKAQMIKLAPKTRRYGEAFETATNDGYLAQVKKDKSTCPAMPALLEQVEDTAKRLQAALAVSTIEVTTP